LSTKAGAALVKGRWAHRRRRRRASARPSGAPSSGCRRAERPVL